MKVFFLTLLIPTLSLAANKITCTSTERYNDQRIENTFSTLVESDTAFKQVASKRDSNIIFVTYYSKANDNFGARINDQGLGTQSGNFIEPSHEIGQVKVRYLKSKPETQLFALDCAIE